MYVVREGNDYKILGSSDSAEDVGALVLDLLKRNDVASAQWWLDQVTKDLKSDPSGWLPAARVIWSGLTPETRGPETIRAAAAALMGRYSRSPEAIRTLQEASKLARNATDKSQIDQALCEAFAKTSQWDDLLSASKRLMVSKIFGDAGFSYFVQANQALGNWKEIETAALDRTKASPRDHAAWRALAIARMRTGNAAGADEAIARLKDMPGDPDAREMGIWNQIFSGKVTADTIASIKNPSEGLEISKGSNQYLAGLASAMIGKTDQALDSLKAAIGDSPLETLDARAWVLYGDICDQYGFKEAAKDSWQRARSAKNETDAAKWSLATLK